MAYLKVERADSKSSHHKGKKTSVHVYVYDMMNVNLMWYLTIYVSHYAVYLKLRQCCMSMISLVKLEKMVEFTPEPIWL